MRYWAILLAVLPLAAAADDTVLSLGVGDRFVVKDSSGTERLILDGTTGELSAPAGVAPALRVDATGSGKNFPAILSIGDNNAGDDHHPLALVRADNPVGREVTWLWKGGGGAITNLSLKIDGRTHVGYNTTTGEIITIVDPVGPGSTMLQVGADVEYAMTIRASSLGCPTCNPARPNPKAFLVTDDSGDWSHEMHWDGRMRWGDAGPTFNGPSDGVIGEASFDTALYRVENGADETMEFELDGDNDGGGTRRVAVANPHPQGTGSAALGGVLVWGDRNIAAIDSGDEVCASVPGGTGLSCQATLDPTDGSEHACNAAHPASEATASGYFQAICF